MNKDELLNELNKLVGVTDVESAHIIADNLLLKYINDNDITQGFEKIEKWYS